MPEEGRIQKVGQTSYVVRWYWDNDIKFTEGAETSLQSVN